MEKTDYYHSLPEGARIDWFEIRSVLGSGGFGITYLAWDERLQCQVAIKEYLPSDMAVRKADGSSVIAKSNSDRENFEYGLKSFLEEARTLALFNEPNIIRVRNFLEANDTAYMVMDYEEGESLDVLLKREETLDEAEIKEIIIPILDGLRAVHKAEFLHRDIKPGNIYLRNDGPPVLIDFGAARQALGEHSRSMTGIVTAGYAPFEQYSSRGKQGPWTDLYAIGATMYRCISGHAPVEASERIAAMGEDEPDPLIPATELGEGKYSKAFLEAIDWMLQPAAKNRPHDVTSVLDELLGKSSQTQKRQSRTSSDTPMKSEEVISSSTPTERKGSGGWVVIAGFVALALWLIISNWNSEQAPVTTPKITVGIPVGLDAPASSEETSRAKLQAGRLSFEPEMVDMPVGSFRMGDLTGNGENNEKPVRQVKIRPFLLGKTEVTFMQWDACVDAGGCSHRPDDEGWGRDDRPVINVSWEDIKEYIVWLNKTAGKIYRLPSEAEWEYAARAGSTAKYSWGDGIDCTKARYGYYSNQCGKQHSSDPVKSYLANAFGLYDMHGNVWEWVGDCWKDNYADAPTDASVWSSGDCSGRVLRGGSWNDSPSWLRSAERLRNGASDRNSKFGFRLAQDSWKQVVVQLKPVQKQPPPPPDPKQQPFETVMVEIPGGSFRMGDLIGDGGGDEKPVHGVQIKPFLLAETETTFAQWDACVDAGGCSHKPDDKGWGRGNRPVINVSSEDIKEYIVWLNKTSGKSYRLPSEAEWEYAARAGSTTKYSWGDGIDCTDARYGYLGYCGKRLSPDPVKSYQANAYGLFDMHGNVWEWVADCWENSVHDGAPTDGSSLSSDNCTLRVLRGGSWSSVPSRLRSASRITDNVSVRNSVNGFRLAQDRTL